MSQDIGDTESFELVGTRRVLTSSTAHSSPMSPFLTTNLGSPRARTGGPAGQGRAAASLPAVFAVQRRGAEGPENARAWLGGSAEPGDGRLNGHGGSAPRPGAEARLVDEDLHGVCERIAIGGGGGDARGIRRCPICRVPRRPGRTVGCIVRLAASAMSRPSACAGGIHHGGRRRVPGACQGKYFRRIRWAGRVLPASGAHMPAIVISAVAQPRWPSGHNGPVGSSGMCPARPTPASRV